MSKKKAEPPRPESAKKWSDDPGKGRATREERRAQRKAAWEPRNATVRNRLRAMYRWQRWAFEEGEDG